MMALVARTSRRSALLAGLATAVGLVLFVVIKDMNDKLVVMTASNQNYQRMTDAQSDKIRKLQLALKDEQSEHTIHARRFKTSESELKSGHEREKRKLQKDLSVAREELRALHQQYEILQNELEDVNEKHVDASHHMSRLQAESEKMAAQNARLKEEMHQQLAAAKVETDRYKNQYVALFRQHQQSSDSIQNLEKERERLQLQLSDFQRGDEVKSSSSKSPQVPEPNVIVKKSIPGGIRKPSSTPKSVLKSQINIEEPVMPNGRFSSTTVVAPLANRNNVVAPVAAEPPHVFANNLNSNQNLVAQHQDVMEAPKSHQGQDFNGYLHQQPFHQQQQQYQVYQQHQQPIDKPQLRYNYAGAPQQQQQHFQQPQKFHNQQHVFEVPPMHFQRRETGGGQGGEDEDLDRAVDSAKVAHPGLREEAGMVGEEDDDDDVDGQLQQVYNFDLPLFSVLSFSAVPQNCFKR